MTREHLDALEAQLTALTNQRNEVVNAARARIEQANRDYDKRAVPLHRQIDKLRKELDPEPESTTETTKPQPVRKKKPAKKAELPPLEHMLDYLRRKGREP